MLGKLRPSISFNKSKSPKFVCLGLLLVLSNSACSGKGSYYDSSNFNQHTKRFQNLSGLEDKETFKEFSSFAFDYFTRDKDISETKGFPVEINSRDKLNDFRNNVIWVGHSTILLNYNDLTILTDPQFYYRASPFHFIGPKRVTPVPFKISDLPEVDVVLISHNHYDHLDEKSIKKLVELQPGIKFLVPLGLKSLLKKWGVQSIEELDWWQAIDFSDANLQPTPVKHWSKRTPFDRNKSLWAGWMVRWSDFSFYFAGDTGYSQDFKLTAQKLGKPTLAAIPIGAYEPRNFMKSSHINPTEAVKVFQDLGSEYALAIHWGTFKLTLEKMDEPPRKLQSALEKAGVLTNKFRVLKHGASWKKPFQIPRNNLEREEFLN